jgi:hypothetical protein
MAPQFLWTLFLTLCAPNIRSQSPSPPALTQRDLGIAGLSAKNDTADTRRVLGTPASVSHHDYHGNDEILHLTDWHYRDAIVSFYANGRFYSATLTGPSRRTIRGLAVGDSTSRMIKLYGQYQSDGGPFAAYSYRPPGPHPSNWGMIVELRDGVVHRIVLGVIGAVD